LPLATLPLLQVDYRCVVDEVAASLEDLSLLALVTSWLETVRAVFFALKAAKLLRALVDHFGWKVADLQVVPGDLLFCGLGMERRKKVGKLPFRQTRQM